MKVDITMDLLSTDDLKLLVEILFRQQYAIEIICSELNDIEAGLKSMDDESYQRLVSLYDRLRVR